MRSLKMSSEFFYSSLIVVVFIGAFIGYYLAKKDIHLPFL